MPAAALEHDMTTTFQSSRNSNNAKKKDSSNSDATTISSLLKKYNLQNHLFEAEEIDALFSSSSTGTGTGSALFYIESIDDDALMNEWLLAAEDFITRTQEMSFCYSHYKQKHLHSIAFLKTALVGVQEALQVLSIDTTFLPTSWRSAVNAIISNTRRGDEIEIQNEEVDDSDSGERIVICGAKGVGKSTCMKYLVNRLLGSNDKVAVIDCDVGQSEFTTSGLVSLHVFDDPIAMPSHLNLRKPELSYFIGDISTKSEPEMVIKCIELLNTRYIQVRDDYITKAQQIQRDGAIAGNDNGNMFSILNESKKPKQRKIKMPLVINTDGWIKYMV